MLSESLFDFHGSYSTKALERQGAGTGHMILSVAWLQLAMGSGARGDSVSSPAS